MPSNGAGESRSVYVVQRHFRRVRRGYDPEEVDRHLQVISEWFRDSRAGDEVRELEKQIQARERAVAEREQEARRLIETNRLEAEATLDGARLRMNADKEQAQRILARGQRGRRADSRRRPSAQAAEILDQARLDAAASETILAAEQQAQQLVADATAEAERLRTDAQQYREQRLETVRADAAEEARKLRAQAEKDVQDTSSAASARSIGWSRPRAGSGASPRATPTSAGALVGLLI